MRCFLLIAFLLGHGSLHAQTNTIPRNQNLPPYGRAALSLPGDDRVPESRTLRAKISLMASKGTPQQWMRDLCAKWMNADPQEAAYLYVDGHVRVYCRIGGQPAPALRLTRTHKHRQWTMRNVIEHLCTIRRERIVMAGVEFEKVTTPQADQQRILDALLVKL